MVLWSATPEPITINVKFRCFPSKTTVIKSSILILKANTKPKLSVQMLEPYDKLTKHQGRTWFCYVSLTGSRPMSRHTQERRSVFWNRELTSESRRCQRVKGFWGNPPPEDCELLKLRNATFFVWDMKAYLIVFCMSYRCNSAPRVSCTAAGGCVRPLFPRSGFGFSYLAVSQSFHWLLILRINPALCPNVMR